MRLVPFGEAMGHNVAGVYRRWRLAGQPRRNAALPKTLNGKIMRRILRKIAEGDVANLGYTSTLANPAVVADLLAGRP